MKTLTPHRIRRNNRKNASLVTQYKTAKNRLDEILAECQSRTARKEKITRFLYDLKKQEELLTEFDEALWYATIDWVTVYSDKDIAFDQVRHDNPHRRAREI